jgi:hypothetical protein
MSNEQQLHLAIEQFKREHERFKALTARLREVDVNIVLPPDALEALRTQPARGLNDNLGAIRA